MNAPSGTLNEVPGLGTQTSLCDLRSVESERGGAHESFRSWRHVPKANRLGRHSFVRGVSSNRIEGLSRTGHGSGGGLGSIPSNQYPDDRGVAGDDLPSRPEAFCFDSESHLVALLGPIIKSAARRVFRPNAGLAVEDLEQIGLIEAVMLARENAGHTRAYFITKATGRMFDEQLRELRRQGVMAISLNAMLESGRDIADEAGSADMFAALYLQHLLATAIGLRDEERRVLDLIYWRDCTQGEAAAIMEVTQQEVSRVHKRALHKVRLHVISN